MTKPKPLDKWSEQDLIAKLHELRKTDVRLQQETAAVWAEQGQLLDHLRTRHMNGQLETSATWPQYCYRHFGMTGREANDRITVFRAEDPLAAFREIITKKEKNKNGRNPDRRTIIIRRPGVVYAEFEELDEAGKRLFLRKLWRDYPKLVRSVGDEVTDRDEEAGEASYA